MVSIAETISHPERAHLRETVQQELKKHDTWSQDLKLSLQRSWMVYQGPGMNSEEWVSVSQEVHAMMQIKPNNFQISLDVFPKSVFEDSSEWFDVACWSQVKPIAHEVIARKAILLLNEQKYDDAFELTLSGTSGSAMDANHYALAFPPLLQSFSKLNTGSSLYTWELTSACVRFCRMGSVLLLLHVSWGLCTLMCKQKLSGPQRWWTDCPHHVNNCSCC
ncbi:TPA: hypothetical protein ACH3X3_008213 [Trebouxia sp. C0006]